MANTPGPDKNGTTAEFVRPQGHLSGLDADTLDGMHAADIITAAAVDVQEDGSDVVVDASKINFKDGLVAEDRPVIHRTLAPEVHV